VAASAVEEVAKRMKTASRIAMCMGA
jgi:hypothetical protein